MRILMTVLLILLLGCGGSSGRPADGGLPALDGGSVDGGSALDGGTADGGAPTDGGLSDGGAGSCPAGLICVGSLPFVDARDTTLSARRDFSSYGCAPATDESGPEFVYRLEVAEPGLLGVRVDSTAPVDIDVHLLTQLDAGACLRRDNIAFSQYVTPGTYYVVADTWVGSDGVERLGAYSLMVTFRAVPEIPCAMRSEPMPRWTGDTLQLPATGPVVLEAHLVTPDEAFADGWPTSGTDEIERHYALSEAATGYVMRRGEPWAPYGEGGSMWGQGSSVKPPLAAEGWYVNMYWKTRPPNGERMIIRQPSGPFAVVAAAGYETGPGSATAIGGATEEIHDFLGTVHRSELTMGFAVDQTLPYGPVRCAP